MTGSPELPEPFHFWLNPTNDPRTGSVLCNHPYQRPAVTEGPYTITKDRKRVTCKECREYLHS